MRKIVTLSIYAFDRPGISHVGLQRRHMVVMGHCWEKLKPAAI